MRENLPYYFYLTKEQNKFIMQKSIIAAVVGGIILFIWQFLSWTMLNIHESNQKHTENQDAIIEALSANLSEDGVYFIPRVPPGTSSEDARAYQESQMGKPWALVNYRSSFDSNMGMNMTRGLLVNIISVFILAWLLGKVSGMSMSLAIMASIGVGLIGHLNIEYIESIWFETNSLPGLIDTVVQWGLCGVWLGWFLGRK